MQRCCKGPSATIFFQRCNVSRYSSAGENFQQLEIIESEFEHDIEDLIQREDMVVTVTNAGYIKRVPLSTYRAQRRGGKGRSGMATREEDFVSQVFVVSTHTPVLFFSSTGYQQLFGYQRKWFRRVVMDSDFLDKG